MQTWIQIAFAPLKRILPAFLSGAIRGVIAAAFAPFFHYYRQGFLHSAMAARAVDRFGQPLPWYTYPTLEFLRQRTFKTRHILEFGAGQSTHWWSRVAASVTALESNREWLNEIQRWQLPNATLHFADAPDSKTCVAHVRQIMAAHADKLFDIIVIDGLYRAEMVDIAIPFLSQDGAIICDDSEGYGLVEAFSGTTFQRVDFYGARAGVVLIGCTSIFFKEGCFLFGNAQPTTHAHASTFK